MKTSFTKLRQLSLSKKPRGAKRRLRALQRWATSFKGWFPDDLSSEDRYCNFKIPILQGMVEGRHATQEWKSECGQRLIDACNHLIQAKPSNLTGFRVTCVICIPDIFSSEVCIYTKEEYFQSMVTDFESEDGFQKGITDRSLSKEWGLALPSPMIERGIVWCYNTSPDPDDHFVSEHWYFGEIS